MKQVFCTVLAAMVLLMTRTVSQAQTAALTPGTSFQKAGSQEVVSRAVGSQKVGSQANGAQPDGQGAGSPDTRNERQKALLQQTARLFDMANELKVQVDKTNKNILSLKVVEKAEEIETLAKGMKGTKK